MPVIAADTGRTPWLLCRAGDRLCGLPLANVVEIMRLLPIEPLARAPPFVLGISILRGSPVPVVDAGLLFGEHTARPDRLVAIKAGAKLIALAFTDVLGLRPIGADSATELPSLLQEAAGDVVSAISTLDAELLLFLNTARIVPDGLYESLSPEEGAL